MTQVSVHEAKTHLSRLLNDVEAGEEVIIARNGQPVAKIVPVHQRLARQLGGDEGLFKIPEDFDDEDPEILAMFYGDDDP
ncbi:MAG: type II toxin-antitoxin system Phd/YefM family antitoxin [Tepidiformaceae bacterium]